LRLVLTQPAIEFSQERSHIRDLAFLLKTRRGSEDIIVLPELIGASADRSEYLADLRWLSTRTGAWVVGGSHHWMQAHGLVNCGAVVDPGGEVVAAYEKSHPYGQELDEGVVAGKGAAVFEINGLRCTVLICADFWYTSSFCAPASDPDIVLVPSFSFSQRSTPSMAKARWRHAAIARAYEFAVFVGISDWAYPVAWHGRPSSGVAGFADPNPPGVAGLYQALGRRRLRVFDLDMAALRDLRANRNQRGFSATQPHSRE
jgi:omega-amidase